MTPSLSLNPYPTHKPSGVGWLGDVPEHWEVRRLVTSAEGCINGIWGGEPNGRDDLPCVRVADFDRGRFRVRLAKPTIRAIALSERNRRLLKKGDLLLEKSGGGDLQPVGVVVLYDHDVEAVCSNFVARMPIAADCDAIYLTYLHSHLYAIRLNVRSIKQTTGIQNIDSSSYLREAVAFPPLPEQRAMVRYLDHADRRIRRYISAKRKLIVLLAEEKQAVINRAVTRGLDPNVRLKPSGVEWLGDVPEHWEVHKLRQCVSISGGMTPNMEVQRFWNGQVPWVTPKDMKQAVIGDSSVKTTDAAISETSLRLVKPPVVLMVVRGMILARRVPIAYTTVPVTINQDMKALRAVNGANARFLACSLASAQEAFVPLIDEAGHGTRRLPMERWRELPMAMPPPSEQAAIVEHLNKATAHIDSAIAHARRQIELLQEYRTRLIADVVTGKLDVREAAADLPDENDEAEPIAESVPQIHGLEEDLYDADNLEEESAIESEVSI